MSKKNRTMVEPFESNGIWWKPGQDRKVPGALIFDPKSGITVILFQPIEVEYSVSHTRSSKIIHGIVDSGLKISLLDCYETIVETKFSVDGIYSSSRIIATKCVIGAHLCNNSRFNNFRFMVHNYAQFLCKTGIRRAADHEAGFVWDRVNSVEFEIDGNTILFNVELQGSHAFFDFSAGIKENASIAITTTRPVDDLDKAILGVFQSLKTMLEFSLGYPVPILQFHADATDANGQDENIEIFFSQPGYDTQKIGNPHHDMLFSFCKLSDEDVCNLCRTWHKFYNENRFTIDVVINAGVKGPGNKHPEQSFFFLVSSLEALHRSYCKSDKSTPRDKLKKITKQIDGCIDSKRGPDLRQRLIEVLDVMPQSVSDRIINREALVKNLKSTRTYIVHHIVRQETNTDILPIWHLTNVLWGITVVYILVQLGFSSEILGDIVQNKINMLNAFNWTEEVSRNKSNK